MCRAARRSCSSCSAQIPFGKIESIVHTENIDIPDPEFDTVAGKADLAGIAGHKAGVYVVRYFQGSKTLAKGTFTLTK